MQKDDKGYLLNYSRNNLDNSNPKFKKNNNFDQFLYMAGGFGRYQFTICFFMIATHVLGNSILYGLPFLIYEPSFLCDNGNGQFYKCNAQTVLESGRSYKIDYRRTY